MSSKFSILPIFSLFFLCLSANGQHILAEKTAFTRQDTLRGSITPEREWWDLTYYHLDIEVKPDDKFISGSNTIQYKVLSPNQRMQIDLQEPMEIEKIVQNGKPLDFTSEGNAHFVTLYEEQKENSVNELTVFYSGKPREARRAPWDGGFSWKKDDNGNHFVATSCQGLGASVWWPCKDHMYDEVDSMDISVTVPKGLTDVSNGRLINVKEEDSLPAGQAGTTTFNWTVKNPINNYGVNVNMGDYVHFSEVYEGENGPLDMDYYVLRDNLEKAKEHFKDAPRTMEALEHWFGPYPFYEDGYKLVEVPYLGMEHQSSVTYGNHYLKGYLGRDLSGTGWGLKFDYLIIHESGHEWFANNITYKDIADMWVHEGFTTYSECLFVEYFYGKEAGADYVIGSRRNIGNRSPMIGSYNVNKDGSGDMYAKGANILHTLRQLVEDDEKWRTILRGLNKDFYHQTVTSKQIEDYISEKSGIDLTEFFDQYLRTANIPTFEYKTKGKKLMYRWTNVIDKFDMPVQVSINEKTEWLYPTKEWKTIKLKKSSEDIKVVRDFYVEVKPI